MNNIPGAAETAQKAAEYELVRKWKCNDCGMVFDSVSDGIKHFQNKECKK